MKISESHQKQSNHSAKKNSITTIATCRLLERQWLEGQCVDPVVTTGTNNGQVQLVLASSRNEKLFKAIHHLRPGQLLQQRTEIIFKKSSCWAAAGQSISFSANAVCLFAFVSSFRLQNTLLCLRWMIQESSRQITDTSFSFDKWQWSWWPANRISSKLCHLARPRVRCKDKRDTGATVIWKLLLSCSDKQLVTN